MHILHKRLLLVFIIFCSFLTRSKAQVDIDQISGVEVDKYERIIDSIHHTYTFFEYPRLVKRLVFISKVAQENKNEELWLISKFYTADIFYKANRNNEARKILQEIEDPNISEKNKQTIFPYNYYLAVNVLLELGELDEAKQIYETKIASINDDKGIHSFIKDLTTARILILENNFEEALLQLDQLEQLLNSYPSSYLLSQVYFLKSKIYITLENSQLATKYAKLGQEYASVNDYTLVELEFTELLVKLANDRQDSDLAINYLKEANRIKDEIIRFQSREFTEERITDANSIQSAVDTISELSLANSEQEKSLKFNQLTIILSALFIGILSLFTVSLYKNNNLRARANQLLQQKNTDLIESREKALAATKYREQFLSTITHELRTPIYAVTGLTYLLLKENPTKQQKEHLKSLKHSGEHLLSLINNILDINKLESNKINKVNFDFYIKSQLKNTIKTLEKTAAENDVELHLEVDPEIPKLLNGDMVKISQVIINLVANAIKFSKNGDVWIRAKLVKEQEKTASVHFEVEDNGRGIPKNKHKQIFEKFNQGTDNINANYGGTGLGLPIVKNLLKFLNSDIDLESEPGKGSKFYFTITFNKVVKHVTVDAVTDFDDDEEDVTEEMHQRVFDNKKVLVVEDNKLNQKITCKILEKKNLFCDIANNGKEAVELATKNKYDIILMDIHMPIMDGIEATKTIRHNEDDTPIIALTAVSISEELKDFLKYGFNDIIPKPYKTELFYEKIYRCLVGPNRS
ncbi:ATP-binding protein [Mesonia sp.]|uniref:tetratricopeptide repeat-containing hybrid sensor histidine kinase/response regulator n=1 Tax=Mesonia sp. TaxID=1960830 RepID=UPI001758FE4E|nr:ATP-binding protein [Mesonia sp.]HIB36037.1 response regulator [Mesonia sp.]HIO25958.1 response regulator [Flavobacteriaceae bacterium]